MKRRAQHTPHVGGIKGAISSPKTNEQHESTDTSKEISAVYKIYEFKPVLWTQRRYVLIVNSYEVPV